MTRAKLRWAMPGLTHKRTLLPPLHSPTLPVPRRRGPPSRRPSRRRTTRAMTRKPAVLPELTGELQAPRMIPPIRPRTAAAREQVLTRLRLATRLRHRRLLTQRLVQAPMRPRRATTRMPAQTRAPMRPPAAGTAKPAVRVGLAMTASNAAVSSATKLAKLLTKGQDLDRVKATPPRTRHRLVALKAKCVAEVNSATTGSAVTIRAVRASTTASASPTKQRTVAPKVRIVARVRCATTTSIATILLAAVWATVAASEARHLNERPGPNGLWARTSSSEVRGCHAAPMAPVVRSKRSLIAAMSSLGSTGLAKSGPLNEPPNTWGASRTPDTNTKRCFQLGSAATAWA